MIPTDKFKQLFQRLLERSRKGQVEWLQDRTSTYSFNVQLPESLMRIQRISPRTDPDYFQLDLYNKDGVRILSQIADESETDNDWLPLLSQLYEEAFRCVTGWDKVLADLEAAVASESHVGTPF